MKLSDKRKNFFRTYCILICRKPLLESLEESREPESKRNQKEPNTFTKVKNNGKKPKEPNTLTKVKKEWKEISCKYVMSQFLP